jgi:PilZ domain
MLDTSCRTCQRVRINKGLSYNGLDVNSNVVERYTGVALNVSQNGIQLETDRIVETKYILLMFFDYRSNYVAARGEVIYSKKNDSGKFWTGVSFQGKNGDNLQFVKKLILSYHYQKRVPIFIS